MGITNLLDRAVENWPANIALSYQGQAITYQTLRADVNSLAKSLMVLGLKKGDVLGVYLLSNPQFAMLYLACFRIGVIVSPMSFRLQADDLAYLIDYAKPSYIFSQSELLSVLLEARPDYQGWQLALLDKPAQSITKPYVLWDDLLESGTILDSEFPSIDAEDPATYFSTSGTTGQPKLVIHQHKQFLYNAEYHAQLLNITEQDVSLAPLAICFNLTFGHQFMAALYSGSTLELMPTFDPLKVLKRIQSKQITLLYMVPAMYSALLNCIPEAQLITHKLRSCIVAGEAVPLALHQKFKQVFGLYLSEGIGMSEALFYAINIRQGYKLGSQGPAVIGAEIKIMDEVGEKELALNEMGEIWIKSPTILTGYLNKPEQTQKALINGWLRTGDLGQLDSEAYMWFRGRINSLILHRGHRIAPIEIEAALYQHPDVLEAAVLGVKAANGDNNIIAYVVCKADSVNAPADIQKFVQRTLPDYKWPSLIIPLDNLPRGISNKIDRRRLQEMADKQNLV
ncbi:MAG: class I adenylate-forming enzyme family protein [Gammaproteobacteria bacterium]|nr:class I adenylate-forming enzyme family protein [Gammaproteobacteria bacterium]